MNKIEQMIEELCPEGVEYKKLGEIDSLSLNRGIRVVKSQLESEGEIPVFQNSLTPLGFSLTANCKANTTFIICAGSAGSIGYSNVPFWAADDCFYFDCNRLYINDRYIYHLLLNNQSKLMSKVRKASVPRLSRIAIENIEIPLPPLPIQEEIVRILDKFTTLEAELEAELDCRKRQYEYYRNKLLNFEGDENVVWKKMSEVGTFIRGNGLQKKDFTESGVGCIHYGQIYTYYGTFATKTKSFVSPEFAKKLKKANKGDIIIATTSENVEDVCKAVAWLGEDDIAISGDAYIYKHNQNTKFIAYMFQTERFFQFKRKHVKGTKVMRVTGEKMENYEIPIPPLSEQQRIADILDRFDSLTTSISEGLPAEIAARHQQYEYYRDKLLTFKKKTA